MSFVFKLKKPWIPRSSRRITFLSACFFVIPAEAGIQTFFSFDVLQLFYERTKTIFFLLKKQGWIDIPEEVIEKYLIWRPTPVYRAHFLEKFLKTPTRIYFKNEGVNPPGSHKPNTAIAQAYYNKVFGIKRLATETYKRPGKISKAKIDAQKGG